MGTIIILGAALLAVLIVAAIVVKRFGLVGHFKNIAEDKK